MYCPRPVLRFRPSPPRRVATHRKGLFGSTKVAVLLVLTYGPLGIFRWTRRTVSQQNTHPTFRSRITRLLPRFNWAPYRRSAPLPCVRIDESLVNCSYEAI